MLDKCTTNFRMVKYLSLSRTINVHWPTVSDKLLGTYYSMLHQLLRERPSGIIYIILWCDISPERETLNCRHVSSNINLTNFLKP